MLVAIRNGEGKGIYKCATKTERLTILKKYPSASVRLFKDKQQKEAEKWAKIDLQEKTPTQKTVMVQKSSTPPPTLESKEEYNNEDIVNIINLYKEKGYYAITLSFENGTKINIVLEDIYYINKNVINFTPLLGEKITTIIEPLKFKKKDTSFDRNKDFVFENIKKSFKNLSSEINYSVEELINLIQNKKDLISVLPKTEFKIIGNFLYFKEAGEIDTDYISNEIWDEFDFKYFIDPTLGEDVSFNINNIKKISPYEFYLQVTDKEWLSYFKKGE